MYAYIYTYTVQATVQTKITDLDYWYTFIIIYIDISYTFVNLIIQVNTFSELLTAL